MIIYVDILIIVNFLVDYFLILLTVKVTDNNVKTYRIILSALIGGISSLYIFIPINSILLDFAYKTFLSTIMSLILIGFPSLKQFMKFKCYLFIITLTYGGIFYALNNILNSSKFIFENGITYFNISPIFLCVTTVIYYFLSIIFSKIFSPTSISSEKCEIEIKCNENIINLKGILDTGNSITDCFGKSEIIIADSKYFDNFIALDELNNRFRLIPCSTISGQDLLKGYRCDTATITSKNKTIKLEKPILAISKTKLNDGYDAIINPKIFL